MRLTYALQFAPTALSDLAWIVLCISLLATGLIAFSFAIVFAIGPLWEKDAADMRRRRFAGDRRANKYRRG